MSIDGGIEEMFNLGNDKESMRLFAFVIQLHFPNEGSILA